MAFFKFRTAKNSDAGLPLGGAPQPVQSIEVMRQRARHRLIGAALLVLIGVVGFPLLFDSQPRPVAVDIQIDIPDKAKVKPLELATAATIPATASMPAAPESVAAASAVNPDSEATAKPVVATPAPVTAIVAAPAAAATPVATGVKPKAEAAETAKALALLDGKDSNKPGERFVVQVGAYSEVAKLREVRQKLEKAGLKTYTQVIDSQEGKRTRVRVGPFASAAEADAVAARIKSLELPVAVLKM